MRMKPKNFSTLLILFGFSSAGPIFSAYEPTSKAYSALDQRYIELFSQGERLRQEGEFEKAGLKFKDCLTLADKFGSEKDKSDVNLKQAVISWNLGRSRNLKIFAPRHSLDPENWGLKKAK